jgi:acetyltransferase-like isoleucine patch superfamily enzyme
MSLIKEILGFIKRNGTKTIIIHAFEIYLGALIRFLPGPEGIALRAFVYRMLFKKCQGGLLIYPHVYMTFTNRISAGKRLAINVNTYIDGRGQITFGDYVMIGPNCVIASCGHGINDTLIPMYLQPVHYGEITIEDDVWIGGNVTIVPGVRIGHGSVVAAGSVVTSNLEPLGIYGGIPAKLIKKR